MKLPHCATQIQKLFFRYDGEVFTAADQCNKCWCNAGEIICPFEDGCENSVSKRRSFDLEVTEEK